MTIYPNLDGVKNASSKLKGLIRVTPLDLIKDFQIFLKLLFF